jgi:di/tripeptidase
MDDRVENLMAVCNIDLTAKTFGPAWPYNALSGLPGVIQKVYKSQNGTEMNLLGVNYEVECAEFVVKNPNLDMISIGADISSPNTVDETVDISSIDTLRKLTKGIIIQLMN